jgi:hypothetical protein
LADRYSASFAVVECVCSDVEVHRRRVDGRRREIPGWYELKWEWVERGRQLYEPLSEPKVVIDAIEPLEHNLGVVMHHLSTERVHARESTRSRPDLASTPTHITVGADQQ